MPGCCRQTGNLIFYLLFGAIIETRVSAAFNRHFLSCLGATRLTQTVLYKITQYSTTSYGIHCWIFQYASIDANTYYIIFPVKNYWLDAAFH
jgi:hypothetical protein